MSTDAPALLDDPTAWNDVVASLPGGHLLQSWEWGQLKEMYGWRARRLVWRDRQGRPQAAAQVLRRGLGRLGPTSGMAVLYCPKGPVLEWDNQGLRTKVLAHLQALASREGAIFIKIDPDLPLGHGLPGESADHETPLGRTVADELSAKGWRPSTEQVQFRNTLTLDLRPSEEDLLGGMKQKTRYNVRLAARRGVHVRRGGLKDLDLLYRMYAETSVRDGFVIRNRAYYEDAWGSFVEAGLAQPLVAEVEGEPIAALIVYKFGDKAWYLYGMSRQAHRERMPNHLLQWEAIRWAKEQGCTCYDLWGAPDRFDEGDPMWGVYRFKRGFGAQVIRTLGAWDYATRPALYWSYTVAMPRILAFLRARGRAQTRQLIE